MRTQRICIPIFLLSSVVLFSSCEEEKTIHTMLKNYTPSSVGESFYDAALLEGKPQKPDLDGQFFPYGYKRMSSEMNEYHALKSFTELLDKHEVSIKGDPVLNENLLNTFRDQVLGGNTSHYWNYKLLSDDFFSESAYESITLVLDSTVFQGKANYLGGATYRNIIDDKEMFLNGYLYACQLKQSYVIEFEQSWWNALFHKKAPVVFHLDYKADVAVPYFLDDYVDLNKGDLFYDPEKDPRSLK